MTPPISTFGALAIIAVTALCTFATRAVPFAFFGGKKGSPAWIAYLGRVLPPAMIAILVIYCLRNIAPATYPFGIPELISVAVAAGLQKLKHNNLLSILCSTALYMFLIQTVFHS